MPPRKADGPYRELPLGLIDQPALPIRESFDQAALEELTQSIRDVGVLQPIAVEQHLGRFRILAGHRRFTAATRAGLHTIPAVIRDTRVISGQAVTIHENFFREDVNPAEEANYLAHLLEQECAGDVDRLCILTHQVRSYVEGRLLLLRGDPDVFDALRQRRLSMAVARELNRVTDRGYRMMYLDAAIRGGATARIVQEWRIQSESMAPAIAPPLTDGENQFTGLPAPITTMICLFCDSAAEPWEMELVPMHRRCRAIFLDRFLAKLKQGLGMFTQEVQPGGTTTIPPQ
jgi:ParB family chromosome partitioning protein